jgi:hypothetical protein
MEVNNFNDLAGFINLDDKAFVSLLQRCSLLRRNLRCKTRNASSARNLDTSGRNAKEKATALCATRKGCMRQGQATARPSEEPSGSNGHAGLLSKIHSDPGKCEPK